jgi:hypothetical protein
MKPRISGKQATEIAQQALERRPVRLVAPSQDESGSRAVIQSSGLDREAAPPRVGKPSPQNDQCFAPTPDLDTHRKRLREAFGKTMSDEFVEVMLGKLVEALRPSPFDQLEESTLNAGLATLYSMKPQSELEALLAVQIIATGFSGMRFLRQSHLHMDEVFIDVWATTR